MELRVTESKWWSYSSIFVILILLLWPVSYIEIGDIIAEQVKEHCGIDGSNCPTHSVINQSADIPITSNYH